MITLEIKDHIKKFILDKNNKMKMHEEINR